MHASPSGLSLSFTANALQLRFAVGGHCEFPALWLADNDPRHRDAHSGQRLTDVADLPLVPQIREVRLEAGQVIVSWRDSLPDSRFDVAWLAGEAQRPAAPVARPVTPWPDGAGRDARRDCAWLSLQELAAQGAGGGAGARVADWFRRLGSEGLAFVEGVPSLPGAILDAAAAIGLVQQTNYGTLFDVRSIPRAENLAYTDLGLGLHTDNPYRDPVPGFQVLHCLVAAADGGDSLFADGFAIAAALRAADREAFELLAATPVEFAYRSRDAALQAAQPLIRLDDRGECIAVHYNNRSIAPLPVSSPGLAPFYAAYRQFALLLRELRFQMTARLAPGELVVFDNWRILHARTSFHAARHLQGCYLTRDSVFSRSALLRDAMPGDRAR
jgi:gamma-butyrobetaine dioxygenase